MSSIERRLHACLFALVAIGGCAREPQRVPHPNVVLVTLDTTRADHIGAYGAARAATPTFDGIARDGVLFERAWTVTPLTTPAHASLMTGLYPMAHGVRNNGRFRLSPSAATLAEAFAASGYRTAAFVGGFPVTRAFGFAQGFDTFDDDFGTDPRGRARNERPADAVAARAVAWLEAHARDGRPFFAWIHFYDAHEPYEPPPPFAGRFASSPYDGEIAFVDAELGRVQEALRATGAAARTIVAVVGDHGEGLGDHGEATHGLFVYEPMIHVPLVVSAPWGLPHGVRRADPASLVDLYPTLTRLAGLAAPASVDGRDLFGATAAGTSVYAESYFAAEEYGWAPLVAVRRGGQKWIGAPRPERYDLDADPQERTNLAGKDAASDAALMSLVGTVTSASASHTLGLAEGQVDDDLLQRLQSLGYVGGGGTGAPAAGRAPAGRDPKDALADYNESLRAGELLRSGGDAVASFARLVSGDPDNPEFRLRLGMALKARGDAAAAEATYRDLIRRYPGFYLAYRRLTALLDAQGRYADSRDLWLSLRSHGEGALVGLDARLAEAYLANGEADKAEAAAESGLGASPDDAELLTLAGRASERLGRDSDALERYRKALASKPTATSALDGAVALLRRLGREGEARALLVDCLDRSGGDPAVRERAARR
jgi:arylsulfatase A-like enzyme